MSLELTPKSLIISWSETFHWPIRSQHLLQSYMHFKYRLHTEVKVSTWFTLPRAGGPKWYKKHRHQTEVCHQLVPWGSVSYRGWGTWDFPPLSSMISFPPQVLLTSAIYSYYFPTPRASCPLPCHLKNHHSVWNTEGHGDSNAIAQQSKFVATTTTRMIAVLALWLKKDTALPSEASGVALHSHI